MNLLSVRDLEVVFKASRGAVRAVDGLSFDLERGASLGIVGESGSGKTQAALAMMGLLPRGAGVKGSVRFGGKELLSLSPRALNGLRGAGIGMVFQDPMTSLNPHLSIGTQMAEVLERHQGLRRRTALRESAKMLEAVALASAAGAGKVLARYPHEFSGGMRQRIGIAMTLLCRPQLLIADEPTSALDATIQAQILHLLGRLQAELRFALILISHDFNVIAYRCDQTLVMYAGRAMETGPTSQLLNDASHPYTRALLASRPRLDLPRRQPLPTIGGQPPDPAQRIDGCPFRARCAGAFTTCERVRPPLRRASGGTLSACHLEA